MSVFEKYNSKEIVNAADELAKQDKKKSLKKSDVNGNPIAKKVSAYNVFLKKTLKDSKDSGEKPFKTFAEVAEMWKNITDSQKAHYEELAKDLNEKATEERLALGSASGGAGAAPNSPVVEAVAVAMSEESAVKISKSEKKKKKKKEKKARKESMGSEATFDS